jgi:ppGpp synthetase/RelA/SpoT-type nucleotidyltranferase
MAEPAVPTPAEHRAQIAAFTKIRPQYVTYADALKRVLEQACQISFPEALVQARAKTIPSFADKVARRFEKYKDGVNQMTDLCGARVIVQTTEQVKAVRQFIEANFEILEKEDKGLLLNNDEFGYRDMHYIVRISPGRGESLGFTPKELAAIDDKRAEIQVRTWLQHAWADTLHDRIYKNVFKLSPEIHRTGALLAALMEEGDRTFNLFAEELDGLIANYTTYAPREAVEREISIQEMVFVNTEDKKRRSTALRLAHLLAACGNHQRIIELLQPYYKPDSKCAPHADECELLLELGSAFCRANRERPASKEYAKGKEILERAARLCDSPQVPFVPHLRKAKSMRARVQHRLGWALAAIPGEEKNARKCYRMAHECEPANPYFLAEMLGYEMYCSREPDLPASMGATLRTALETCRTHAGAGMELPGAYFTAGRLSLFLEQGDSALGYYALGVHHCRTGIYCVTTEALANELSWIQRLSFGENSPAAHERVITLLKLGQAPSAVATGLQAASPLRPPVVIVAGGAASLSRELAEKVRRLLKESMTGFRGTVISGGTGVGVPGCIGDAARELAAEGKKHFRLIGYIPKGPGGGIPGHPGYDELIRVGNNFEPEQIFRNWSDILASGIAPRQVMLVGFGGGRLSALEYRIALSLGANAGLVSDTGGAVQALLEDPLWSGLPNLFLLPFDAATVRAFVMPCDHAFDPAVLEEMAKIFHARYVARKTVDLPGNMKPWPDLGETYKRANLEQAHYSVEILQAAGFGVREAKGKPVIFSRFSKQEVEHMAELEHGRWNIERLRDGWRHGVRDDAKKLHDCLVPWKELPEKIKPYDRDAVQAFPEILAKAGLEIYRRSKH